MTFMTEPAADPVRRVDVLPEPEQEWIVANGLGGYASGTVLGIPTRRYHGLLIAALPNPAGRVMMLSSLPVQLRLNDGRHVGIGWAPPSYAPLSSLALEEFKLELGLPVWRYAGFGVTIEKRIVVSYQTNTTLITYRVLEGKPLRLELRPGVQFRGHDDPVSTEMPEAYPLTAFGSRIEVVAPGELPKLKLHLVGDGRTSFVLEPLNVPDLVYSTEASRGYESRGRLFSPGRFRAELMPGGSVSLFVSTEAWDTILTMTCAETVGAERDRRRRLLDAAVPPARVGAAAELVLAADQFVIKPAGRREDHIRARASATRHGP
jgi:predicted glycogen debranching enzyme